MRGKVPAFSQQSALRSTDTLDRGAAFGGSRRCFWWIAALLLVDRGAAFGGSRHCS